MFRTTRARVATGLASITLAVGTSLLVLAPGAQAAAADLGTITATSPTPPPTVYAGLNGQAAGTWTVTIPGATSVAAGDTVTIQVDDSDNVAVNCVADNDTVGFSSVPTITNTTVGSTATFTAALSSTAGACTTKGVKNVLTLTATATPSQPGPTLTLSGIKYDVGSAAKPGPVTTKVAPAVAFSPAFSNATISAARAASTNPAILVPPSTTSPIADVAITEQRSGALLAGGACITLDAPTGTKFDTATPIPTVTASGGTGKGVPGVVTVTDSSVSFLVATPSTTATGATTYTISGLRVKAGSVAGPIDAHVGSTCVLSDISTSVRLAYIGTVDRIQGSDRYATARQIAEDQFPGGADTVIIARGDNFPDALAASYLAGSTGPDGAPILLTFPGSVPNDTVQELKALEATHVILVGGTTAITPKVASDLDALPTYVGGVAQTATLSVERIGGADRYVTARNVAEFPGLDNAGTADDGLTGLTCDEVTTAIVATGDNFPDALAAGGLAYGGMDGCGSGPIPLILTNSAGLNPSAVAALINLHIEQVILMGGPQAVSAATATAIGNLNDGITVVRVDGSVRQDTAAKLATFVLGPDVLGDWSNSFLVARPDTFPDALTAASISGRERRPLYLSDSTTSLGSLTAQAIVAYPKDYVAGTLLGGPAALANEVLNGVKTAIAVQPTPIP